MQEEIFRFKQFSINQAGSAMKVGTDGVLLGAWVSLEHEPDSILDVGTGSGMLSLMMAQRSSAELIDAVEIDPAAYEQAVENFEASPWGDRLFCYHASFQEFAEEMDEAYDLILSNPPYYDDQDKTGGGDRLTDPSRRRARFSSNLDKAAFFRGANTLLSDTGRVAVVVPHADHQDWVKTADQFALHLRRITQVRGRKELPLKRSLMEFSRMETEIVEDELVIEIDRHVYTEAYIDLTRDFYLKM